MGDHAIQLLMLSSAVLVAGVVIHLVWRRLSRRPRLPFTRPGSLLTAGEMRFYRALLCGLPAGLSVFVKVRLLDVVDVPKEAWRQFGAPASGMHLDFVLADALTLGVRLVIELDDTSHRRSDVRERDAFKDAALAAAGVALLRVRAAAPYDPAELRARIEAAVGK